MLSVDSKKAGVLSIVKIYDLFTWGVHRVDWKLDKTRGWKRG